jgi:hypothetical protein
MATVSSDHVNKLRRRAEEYRTLADCACSDVAEDAYASLADDYGKLAEGFAAEEFVEIGASSPEKPAKRRSTAILPQFWKILKAEK